MTEHRSASDMDNAEYRRGRIDGFLLGLLVVGVSVILLLTPLVLLTIHR